MSMFDHPALKKHLEILIADAQGIPSALRSSDRVVKDFKTVLMTYAQAFAAEAEAREAARQNRNASIASMRNLFLIAWPDDDKAAADNYVRELFRTAERLFKLGAMATGDDYRKTYEALTGEALQEPFHGAPRRRERLLDLHRAAVEAWAAAERNGKDWPAAHAADDTFRAALFESEAS